MENHSVRVTATAARAWKPPIPTPLGTSLGQCSVLLLHCLCDCQRLSATGCTGPLFLMQVFKFKYNVLVCGGGGVNLSKSRGPRRHALPLALAYPWLCTSAKLLQACAGGGPLGGGGGALALPLPSASLPPPAVRALLRGLLLPVSPRLPPGVRLLRGLTLEARRCAACASACRRLWRR